MSKNKKKKQLNKKIIGITTAIGAVLVITAIIVLSVLPKGRYGWTEISTVDECKTLVLNEFAYRNENTIEYKSNYGYEYKETVGDNTSTYTNVTENNHECFTSMHSSIEALAIALDLESIGTLSGNVIKGGYGKDGSFEFSVKRNVNETVAAVYEISMTVNSDHLLTSYKKVQIYSDTHLYGEITFTLTIN